MIRVDCYFLIWEKFIEQQNFRCSNFGEDVPHCVAPVELSEEGAGGNTGEHLGNIGQEVKWITKEHGFKCRNCLNLGPEKVFFSLH